MPKSAQFTYTQAQLQDYSEYALQIATQLGAAQAAVELSESYGLSVGVRMGELESLEHNRDKSLGITVYTSKKGTGKKIALSRGNASSSDFSKAAIAATVRAAYDIAKYTAADDCAGLVDPDFLFRGTAPDLGLYHPWDLSPETALELALRMEDAAFAHSKQIKNSDGCGVGSSQGQFYMASSYGAAKGAAQANSQGSAQGFRGGYAYSRHSLSIAPIAEQGNTMQRDDWYSSQRNATKLASPESIGQYAAQRSVARLGARKIPTGTYSVLYEAPLAAGLIGAVVQAASGGALYRDASFLKNALDTQILAPEISLIEDPFILGGMGSAYFDSEGARTQACNLVERGFLRSYFLSSYTARKLKMRPTGHAGGSHNIVMQHKDTQASDDFVAMLKKLGTGVLVTDLLGQGVSYLTGDYSRGMSGFWVENGVIQYPIEEVTIAGNLQSMFKNIAAVGADTINRGTKTTGSVLIEGMKIAGK